jgi:hypothetical protein
MSDAKPKKPELRVISKRDPEKLFQSARFVADHAVRQGFNARSASGNAKPSRKFQELTDEIIREHVDGGPEVHVFFISPGTSTTRLGVLDYDNKDKDPSKILPWEAVVAAAKKIRAAAEELGYEFEFLPATSGGGAGLHDYLFLSDPQPARNVRHALKLIVEKAGFRVGTRGLVQGEIEVFPKQDRATDREPGNSIGLPYGRKSVPLDYFDLNPSDEPVGVHEYFRELPSAPEDDSGGTTKSASSNSDKEMELLRLAAALSYLKLNADDYDRWVSYGHAIKHAFGDLGFAVWNEWSKNYANYPGEKEAWRKWEKDLTPRLNRPVTVASIYKDAQKEGWTEDARKLMPLDKTDPKKMALLAQDILIDASIEFFRQDKILVEVGRSGKPSGKIKRPPGSLVVQQIDATRFGAEVMSIVSWRERKANGRWKKAELPHRVSETFLGLYKDWEFPELAGTVEAPTIYRAGREFKLLQEPGYSEESGLYYDPGNVEFEPVPEKPTKEQARAALDRIICLLREVPFVPDDDDPDWKPGKDPGLNKSLSRSVALSAILTGSIRRTLDIAPLHAFDSSTAGTGKTYLVKMVSKIVTGREPPVMPLVTNDEEQGKFIMSVLLAGDPVVLIDNADAPIGGARLNAMITSSHYKDRLLGGNVMLSLPTNCLLLASGNNLQFKGDTTRRAVICRIDAREERPETRTFAGDPLAEIESGRPEFVVACLTVLWAYIRAGRPKPKGEKLKPMGFNEWSLIREALVWLGEPDPAKTMDRIRADDPEANAVVEVMNAIALCYGGREVKYADVIADAHAGANRSGNTGTKHEAKGQLYDALSTIKALNTGSLGRWIISQKDKIRNGLRIVRGGNKSHGQTVRLVGDAVRGENGVLAGQKGERL